MQSNQIVLDPISCFGCRERKWCQPHLFLLLRQQKETEAPSFVPRFFPWRQLRGESNLETRNSFNQINQWNKKRNEEKRNPGSKEGTRERERIVTTHITVPMTVKRNDNEKDGRKAKTEDNLSSWLSVSDQLTLKDNFSLCVTVFPLGSQSEEKSCRGRGCKDSCPDASLSVSRIALFMLLSWHLYSLSESSSCSSSSSLIFLIDLNSREEAGRERHEEAWEEEMPLLYPWKRMSESVVHLVRETNPGEQEKTSLRETERKRHSKFRSDAVFVRLRRRDCEGPKRSWRCLSLFHPMLELFKSLCTLYSLHYTSLLTIDSLSSTEFRWFHSFMFICLVHFLVLISLLSLLQSILFASLITSVSLFFMCQRWSPVKKAMSRRTILDTSLSTMSLASEKGICFSSYCCVSGCWCFQLLHLQRHLVPHACLDH